MDRVEDHSTMSLKEKVQENVNNKSSFKFSKQGINRDESSIKKNPNVREASGLLDLIVFSYSKW